MDTALAHATVRDINLAYRTGEDHQRDYPSTPPAPTTPMVFIHGLGEDSRSWRAQLSHFGQRRPVYAVDIRGHGRSDLGQANGTLDQLADDLIGFVEHVPGPSVCVGFSMGGAIALAAAVKRPDLVTRVIVVCSSSVVGSRVAERFTARADGIDAEGREFAVSALRENLEASVLKQPSTWAEEIETRIEAIGDGRGYANGARAMASMKLSPLTDRLPSVASPVEVLVGELDQSCPWRAAEIIIGAVPDGRAHLLPGVGHFVNIEDPGVLTDSLERLEV